jgi:hypothetical protein
MRSYYFISGTILLFLLGILGCEKSSNLSTQPDTIIPVATQDQTAIGSVIAQDPLFTTDANALSDAVPSLAKTSTAIIPRGWGRKIENASRTVTYNHVDDSTVIATVVNTLTGQVWIRVKETSKDTLIYKPLAETITHKVEFRQTSIAGFDSLRNWKMVAVSGVQGGTANNGMLIQNVTLFINDDTVSVINPLDSLFQFANKNVYNRRWGIRELKPNFATQFKVQVTVKSTDPDSDVVVAHRPLWFNTGCAYGRASMKLLSSVSNGDGTFTRVYENDWKWQSAFAGRYSVYVSAITRQSIYDDQAAFSSNVWALPYVVE